MILVDVYVPSLNETFDFKVDENAEVASVIKEMAEMLSKEVREEFAENEKGYMLCSCEQGRALQNCDTLKGCGIGNGSKLLLA